MRIAVVAGGVLALALTGCASVSVTRLHAPPRAMPARAEDTVELFTSSTPDRPHVEVARLEARDAPDARHRLRPLEPSDFLSILRERAAALGCDALVVGAWRQRTGADGRTAICIAYTDLIEEVVAEPAPPLDQSVGAGAP